MKTNTFIFAILLAAPLFHGCASYRDAVRNAASAAGAIQIRDIHQADYLRSVFSHEPKIKDRYSVTPGSRIVTLEFKDDLPEGKSDMFKSQMIELKNQMRAQFKYEINTLIFIFPSQEFRI